MMRFQMDDMVTVVQLRALTKWINGCNMRCYIILRGLENRVLWSFSTLEKTIGWTQKHKSAFQGENLHFQEHGPDPI